MDTSCLDEEIESLLAIYLDELLVSTDQDGTTNIEIVLHPATGENTEQQYVCITLMLKIPKLYPCNLPDIFIKNPRGFSEEEVFMITKELRNKAKECQGHAMLYQLIELGKEYLTAGNTPSCECPICLYNFVDADVFMKTECYHYFHSYCLASYAEQQPIEDAESSTIRHILCPVCRTKIPHKMQVCKDEFPPPVEAVSDNCSINSSTLKEQQKLFTEIYNKQKANGGIIDVQAEKTKFLLNISSPKINKYEVKVTNACSSEGEPGTSSHLNNVSANKMDVKMNQAKHTESTKNSYKYLQRNHRHIDGGAANVKTYRNRCTNRCQNLVNGDVTHCKTNNQFADKKHPDCRSSKNSDSLTYYNQSNDKNVHRGRGRGRSSGANPRKQFANQDQTMVPEGKDQTRNTRYRKHYGPPHKGQGKSSRTPTPSDTSNNPGVKSGVMKLTDKVQSLSIVPPPGFHPTSNQKVARSPPPGFNTR